MVTMLFQCPEDNKVDAGFRRGDLFDKKRNITENWAGFCSTVMMMAARSFRS